MARQVCFLLLLVVGMINANARVKRVIGGELVEEGEYPFLVSLWYMGKNNPYTAKTPNLHHTCGGSLIGNNWVLTSAACFDDTFLPGLSDTSLWKVVLGMYKQTGAENGATFMKIESVFKPPNYNLLTTFGDIALLKLSEHATLGDRIGLVNYNTDNDCPVTGQKSMVVGWGQTQGEVYGLGSDVPHAAKVEVQSVKSCHDAYAQPEVQNAMGKINIDNHYICAGLEKGGKDACYGDSGSPLLDKCGGQQVVTGIVSTGYGCANAGYPGVYTRVSAFSQWIADTIKDNS